MSSLNLKKFGVLAGGVGLFAIVLAQGCSSDDPQAGPSAGAGGRSNTAGVGGKPSTAEAGAGAKAGSANNGGGAAGVTEDNTNAGAAGEAEGGAAGAATVDPSCVGDDGCFSCEPKNNNQFLNHCVEGGCPASFANSTLTKINLVGTL